MFTVTEGYLALDARRVVPGTNMKILQKTLFIVALLTLSTQTLRHVYVRWVEPRGSALDQFDPPVSENIRNAGSLAELVKQYEEVHSKVKELDEKVVDDTTASAQNSDREPYRSERLLGEAIREWERQWKEIFELRFFWLSGFAFLVLGFFCYRKLRLWLGLTFLIAGFAEMIWATSPYLFGSGKEFDKLLTNKFAFSLSSLVLLFIVGYLISVVVTTRGMEADGTRSDIST